MKMKRQGRAIFGTALGLLAFYCLTTGDETAKADNIVVFEDSFERSELGDPWRIVVPSFWIEDGRQEFGAPLASHGIESSSASTPVFHRLSWCFIACVNEDRLADRSARSAGSLMMSKS